MTTLPDVWLIVGPPRGEGHDQSPRVILPRVILWGNYNRTNTAYTIRRQHSQLPVAIARGGGYDRTHTALADAIARLWAITDRCDGGAGPTAVEAWAKLHGITIYTLTEALQALPDAREEV